MAARIKERCDDGYVELLAKAVTGDLGGKIGIGRRVFLKKSSATFSIGSTSSPISTPAGTTA